MRTTVAAACGTIVLAATVLTAPGAQADPEPQARRVAPTDVASPRPAVARGLIVKTRSGTSDATIERATQKAADAAVDAAVDVARPEPITGGVDAVGFDQLVPADEALAAARAVSARDDVLWAVPDRLVRTQAASPVSTNDPLFPRQRGVWDTRTWTQRDGSAAPRGGYSVRAPYLWKATKGRSSTVVAVLDTGIVASHPDLRGQLVAGYDMISSNVPESQAAGVPDNYVARDGDGRDANPADPGDWVPAGDPYCTDENDEPPAEDTPSSWHGTHVAGIVAARAGNKTGIAGIAPGVRVQPVRVLGRCGGFDSDILAGIAWASGDPVNDVPENKTPAAVINLSLGGSYDTPAEAQAACPAYTEAFARAKARGATTVVAAGNELGDAATSVPAACGDDAVVVGAIGERGYRAFYSNRGEEVDLMAPGGDSVIGTTGILSTLDRGATKPAGATYVEYEGTSMATPAVAAAAALLAGLGVPAAHMREALVRSTSGFAPVDHRLDSVVLKDAAGTSYDAGNLNCRTTTSDCGAGRLDLAKVPAPISRPVLSGRFVPGQRLSASLGTWTGAPTGRVVHWLRDGVEVATGSSYTTTADDLGHAFRVRVTQTTSGFTDVVASSSTVVVKRPTSKVSQSGPTKVSRKGRLAVRVRVTVPGVTSPTGRVRVLDGSRTVASGSLSSTARGSIRLVLPRLKKGKHRLTVRYDGNSGIEARSSASRTIRVS